MAKQILFRLGLVGNGCVNFDDSKTQAFTLKKVRYYWSKYND